MREASLREQQARLENHKSVNYENDRQKLKHKYGDDRANEVVYSQWSYRGDGRREHRREDLRRWSHDQFARSEDLRRREALRRQLVHDDLNNLPNPHARSKFLQHYDEKHEGKPNWRPGDWECPMCQGHNFASKQMCFKCKCARPKETQNERHNRWAIKNAEKYLVLTDKRPGDWDCPICNTQLC